MVRILINEPLRKHRGIVLNFSLAPGFPGTNHNKQNFKNNLKKYNILCAPGSGFAGKGWFRIAYCVAEKTILNSREAFKKAVESK